MEATPQELESLFEAQEIEIKLNNLQKRFDELPQRQAIVNARERQKAISEKAKKLDELKADLTRKMQKIKDEDASLEKKENGVQAAINAAQGDFRNVEARTKELDGIFRRRNVLREELDSLSAELAKTNSIHKQVEDALALLKEEEDRESESFKREGVALQEELRGLAQKRDALLDSVDDSLSDMYLDTIKLHGAVAIGRLEGGKCTVCRSSIESGKLIELKGQAPLSTCPSCGRLMIIQ